MTSGSVPEWTSIDDIPTEVVPAPKLGEIKLDGDEVPDEFKGKTAAELVAHANALAQSLKLSEQARVQSEQLAAVAARSAPPAPPPAPEEPQLNEEQLAEMYQNDPIKAIRVMQQQGIREAARNLESRMGSLFTSTAAMAENDARARYKVEFETLGPEISDLVKQIPNAAQVLTDASAWDRVISLVRGTPGNFEKIQQRYAAAPKAPTAEDARAAQVADAGISMTSSVRSPAPRSVTSLDPIQKEIAGKLGLSDEEYVAWSKV